MDKAQVDKATGDAVKDRALDAYIKLNKEYSDLLLTAGDQDPEKLQALRQKRDQAFNTYSALIKQDYGQKVRTGLIVCLICLPLQIIILYILLKVRVHNPGPANDIFVKSIFLTGSLNIAGFLTFATMFTIAKLKGDA